MGLFPSWKAIIPRIFLSHLKTPQNLFDLRGFLRFFIRINTYNLKSLIHKLLNFNRLHTTTFKLRFLNILVFCILEYSKEKNHSPL